MGVGGCETKTIGYTCRAAALKIFGQGFESPHLHQEKGGCRDDPLAAAFIL